MNDEGDWAGADGEGVHTGADSVVSMQVPVTVTASFGTAYVQCRVNDGQNGAEWPLAERERPYVKAFLRKLERELKGMPF